MHPLSLVKSNSSEGYTALSLKKGRGSCSFLGSNRRCTIYDHRTTYCRQFPYHIYVGDMVSVELNRSCRGTWTDNGADARLEAEDTIKNANERIKYAFMESKQVYGQFYSNCIEAGVMDDKHRIRGSFERNVDRFLDLNYIGNVLDASVDEPLMSLDDVGAKEVDMKDLEVATMDIGMESISTKDPFNAPVYCDEGGNWNLFIGKKGNIEWMTLDDDGDLTKKDVFKADEVPLEPLLPEGMPILRDYLLTLNRRESFLGATYHNMDVSDYEDSMANSYFGCMSVSILDLLWRCSLVDMLFGTGMGGRGIREAILYYDMDRLDAPTIGAFV